MKVTKKLTSLFILLSVFMFTMQTHAIEDYQSKSAEQLLQLAEQLRFTDINGANSALIDAYNLSVDKKNHSTSIEVLLLQAKIAISQKDYFLAQQYLHRAEQLLTKYENVTYKIQVMSAMADVKRYLKKYDESQQYIDEALILAVESEKDELMFNVLEIKGALAKSQHKYGKALDTFLEIEKYAHHVSNQEKMRLYRNIAYMSSKVDEQEASARYYAKGIQLLHEMGNTRDIPENMIDLAVTYRKMSKYDLALEKAYKALELSRQGEDELHELKALVVISIIYRRLNSYEQALDFGIQAYSIYERNNDENGLASAANSIGLIYKSLHQIENAKKYFKQVISLPEKNIQTKYRASAYRELAKIVFDEGNELEGIRLAQEAYNIFTKIGDNNGGATVNKNIGQMYQKMGETEKSLAAFNQAQRVFQETGDIWNEGSIESHLSSIYTTIDPKKAIEHATRSLEIANKTNTKSYSTKAYASLVDANAQLGNYKVALDYALQKELVVAEMNDDSMKKRIAEVHIVLDLEKKEKELQNFKRQQAITTLELNRKQAAIDMLNKEKEIADLENKNTLFFIAIIISLFALVFFISRRRGH